MREPEILTSSWEYHLGPIHMVALLNTSLVQPKETGCTELVMSLLAEIPAQLTEVGLECEESQNGPG